MRIGVVSALGRIERDGVRGYGGLERWAWWFALEAARRGHEVLLFGNVEKGPMDPDLGQLVKGVPLLTEADVLSPDNYARLRRCDSVIDMSHSKPARLADLGRYVASTMWTDTRAGLGRDVYPSAAVREAFRDSGGTVIPIGVPVPDAAPVAARSGGLSFGRLAYHKGHDIAVALARAGRWGGLTVGGHVWPGMDEYYSLFLARMCRGAGYEFLQDPSDSVVDEMIGGATGLLHLHRWIESFSIVAARALCAGTPLLTTDVGAPQEWVGATDGGMVVALADAEALDPRAIDVLHEFSSREWPRERIAERARGLFGIGAVFDRYARIMGVS